MPSSSLSAVVQHLRAAAGKDGGGRTDAELLTQFLNRRDEDALAALVERHAPMVWGVCRRVLHNPHDAEDAFQATFLVLVQKAATVVPREMVANWLHGVAQQTAVRLRASAAKRGWREVQMDVMPEPAEAEARDEELLSRLDEELGRLPERCRALIVLCDLEGRTRKEAARQLGCPEGTVASGLVRARELLAKRLTRRGLAVSGGSLAATLSHSVASADVPASVVTTAINVATLLTAGKAAGVISSPVAALTQGVLKTMFLKKILTTTMAVLALGVAVITGGSLAVGQTEGKSAVRKDVKAPVAEKPMKPAAEQEKEPFTAWGKEVGGLQAGLGFKAGEKRAYHHGETVTLVVRFRNIGKEVVKFEYLNSFFVENPPIVTDDKGKLIPLGRMQASGKFDPPNTIYLEPEKEIELYQMKLELKPSLYATGKSSVQYERVLGNSSLGAITLDPILSKLATGKLELEVKEPEKFPQDKKEAFRAPVPKEKAKPDYWPRRVGDKWVFTLDGREVSDEVARVTEKDGETRVTTTHTDGTDSLEIEYLVKGGAVYQTKSGLYTFDPPIRQVDIELKAGAKWESKTPLTQGVIGNSGEMVAGEEEEVKVPAGTFQAVPVVYTVTEVDGKPIAKPKVYTYWYAAGVGVVKLKYDGGEKVLKAFTPADPKPEAKKVCTPEEAIKIAGDSELTKKFNFTKPAVEFKVEFVTKAIQVKASGEKDAAWVHGHSPDDICLGTVVAADDPLRKTRFVAILTEKVIGQLTKAGIDDLEKHFKGKTVRVSGLLARHDYRGKGSIPEVEIVLDDMSQLEAVK